METIPDSAPAEAGADVAECQKCDHVARVNNFVLTYRMWQQTKKERERSRVENARLDYPSATNQHD